MENSIMKLYVNLTCLCLLLIVGCSQKDEAKEDYMSQCSNWIKNYIEKEKIKSEDIRALEDSACACGFESIESDFRRNRGELKNDKMYWIPLEICVKNQLNNEPQKNSSKNYDTTNLPKSLINEINDLKSATYEDIISIHMLSDALFNDSLSKTDADSLENLTQSYIKNKTLDKDSILSLLTNNIIHSYEELKTVNDSLDKKGESILLARAHGTTYNYSFNLRENSTFDIFYSGSSFSKFSKPDYEIYSGTYHLDGDTVHLEFKTYKPDYIDNKVIKSGHVLRPYNNDLNKYRQFEIIKDLSD